MKKRTSIWLLLMVLMLSQYHAFSQIIKPKSSKTAADQIVTVRGQVKDRLDKPLADVTVQVEGTNTATATDQNGYFELKAVASGTLIFKHVSYKPTILPVNGNINMVVVMDAVEGGLNEVVVVGFGKQKKISTIGAQSTVNVAELKQPVANMATMLAGRISGVVQVQRTGEPGKDGADIWIRGISTFGSGNVSGPLVLVDGVERALNNIDPQDVESFSVLKDASATAVYGVRGANGVILVKTKGGRAQKTQFNFEYTQGGTQFTKTPAYVDGITYMNLSNEAAKNSGIVPFFSQQMIDSTAAGKSPLLYPNVNWMDAIFRKTGQNRRFNFSARGGSQSANYYVSLVYYDETGLLKTDELQQYNSTERLRRYNFTSNLNLALTSTTKVELGVQGYITNVNYPGDGTASDAFGDLGGVTPVMYPVIYPGGKVPGVNPNGGNRNPYARLTQSGYQNQFLNQIYSNVRLTQTLDFITKGLSATGMFAFDAYNNQTRTLKKNPDTYRVRDLNNPYLADGTLDLIKVFSGSNTLSFSRSNNDGGNHRFYSELALNYSRDFGDHSISGLLLYNQTDYTSMNANDLISALPFRNVGVAGRATYGWKSKYFGEFNFGYTGSENFAPDHRYGFFPSFGLGWVLSNENFWHNAGLDKSLSFFKVRISDGKVGSGNNTDGSFRFGYLDFVSTGQGGSAGYAYGASRNFISGTLISQYGSNITWSTSHKTDLGIELKTLRNQLSLTVDFFREHRTGIFLQRASLSDIIGLATMPYGNLGIADNKGVDMTLETGVIHIGKTDWQFRGTYTYNKDVMLENDQPVDPLHPWLNRRGSNILGAWGYQAIGLYTQAEADAANDQNSKDMPHPLWGTVKAGDIKYKDINGDGKIDAYDQVYIHRGDVPASTYGFGFNGSYKGFYVGVFFEGINNAKRMISDIYGGALGGTIGTGNYLQVMTDRWTDANPSGNHEFPRLYAQDLSANNRQTSTWWVRDVSFLRIKTIDIGYYLPEKLIKRLHVKSSRIYLQGVNMFTFSKFKLWDPELNSNNGRSYPPVKNISVGIQVIM